MREQRKVLVVIEVPVVTEVPADWDTQMIEFHMNDSSACINNWVDTFIEQYKESQDKDCYCGAIKGKYVREAQPGDPTDYFAFAAQEAAR